MWSMMRWHDAVSFAIFEQGEAAGKSAMFLVAHRQFGTCHSAFCLSNPCKQLNGDYEINRSYGT